MDVAAYNGESEVIGGYMYYHALLVSWKSRKWGSVQNVN